MEFYLNDSYLKKEMRGIASLCSGCRKRQALTLFTRNFKSPPSLSLFSFTFHFSSFSFHFRKPKIQSAILYQQILFSFSFHTLSSKFSFNTFLYHFTPACRLSPLPPCPSHPARFFRLPPTMSSLLLPSLKF